MGDRKQFMITGLRGSGKTTFCQTLIDLLRSAGWDVAGVLSPPVFVNGKKVGIDVIDLFTNQRKRLANTIDQGGDGPKTTMWAFEGGVVSWGNQVLGKIPPCDFLVVDELGPLEFERREGWINGISAVSDGEYKYAAIVVRPELLEKALRIWPDAEVIQIDDPENAIPLAEDFFRDIFA
ncbi:MAG: nucleoside-triphosphatase [Anaerolineales bacterium]|jgi:nucleoside-triphosphatase THEP1